MSAKLTRAIAPVVDPGTTAIKAASEMAPGEPCVHLTDRIDALRWEAEDLGLAVVKHGPVSLCQTFRPGMVGWFLAAKSGPARSAPASPYAATLTCTACGTSAVRVEVTATHELDRRVMASNVRRIAMHHGWDCSARFVAGKTVEADLCPACREVR